MIVYWIGARIVSESPVHRASVMWLVLAILGIALGLGLPRGMVRGAELEECPGTGSYDSRTDSEWNILVDPLVDNDNEYGSHPFLKPPARIVFSTPVRMEEGYGWPAGDVTEMAYFDPWLKLAYRPINGDEASVVVTITDTEMTCVIHPIDAALPQTDIDSLRPRNTVADGVAPLAVVALWLLSLAVFRRRMVQHP